MLKLYTNSCRTLGSTLITRSKIFMFIFLILKNFSRGGSASLAEHPTANCQRLYAHICIKSTWAPLQGNTNNTTKGCKHTHSLTHIYYIERTNQTK